jgi:mono/diheme cytochrome c family protein
VLSEAFRTTSGPREASDEPEPVATPTVAVDDVTFTQLQAEIFTPHCATQFCHSAQAQAGGLVLEAGAAFDNLVAATPTNATANSSGLLRVDASNADNSYLLIKLEGPDTAALGARMPLIGTPLSEAQIDLVRRWIEAGAEPE